MTLGAAALADLLRRHDVTPRRSLGQHFVIDPNTVHRVVRLAGVAEGDRVVEIGAGCGALTLALAAAGAEVLAVEVDERLLGALREVTAGLNVAPLAADAADLGTWAPRLGAACDVPRAEWKLVANLPYNIATQLVLDVLDDLPQVRSMVVMVQREVAERLAAAPDSGAYGLPSLKVACWATVEILGRVPPTVFFPQPRVESALVSIRRLESPAAADTAALYGLARRAFGQRRKMLRNSLRGVVTPEAFDAAGIAPTARPGELSVADWDRLTTAVAGPSGTHP